MPKSPLERGIARTVTVVPGVEGVPRWRGVYREGNPASIPNDRFYFLQNVRLSGGRLVSRGGQLKINTLPTDGCVEGFFPVDPTVPDGGDGPEYMWLLNGGTETDPAEMFSYDGVTLAPLTQDRNGIARYMYADTNGLYVAAGGSDTGDDDSELRQITPSGGDITQSVLVNLLPEVPPFNEQHLITTMVSFDDLLLFFVATTTIGHQGGYYSWDGATATRELVIDNAGSTKPFMVVLGSELLSAASSLGNIMHRRNLSGTWDTVTFPSVDDASAGTGVYGAAVFGSALYFFGTNSSLFSGDLVISKYESGAITRIRSIASSTTGSGKFGVFGNELFYAWRSDAGDQNIGKFDGASWTDVVSTFASGGRTNALVQDTATNRLYALRQSSFDYTEDGSTWVNVAAQGAEHLAFF